MVFAPFLSIRAVVHPPGSEAGATHPSDEEQKEPDCSQNRFQKDPRRSLKGKLCEIDSYKRVCVLVQIFGKRRGGRGGRGGGGVGGWMPGEGESMSASVMDGEQHSPMMEAAGTQSGIVS